GWGNGAVQLQACTAPAGFVNRPGDCNDAAPQAYPGGVEVCNGLDDDCDGAIDEVADVARGCSALGVCEGREVLASCESGLVCRYRFED
ncbi:MAG: putative metal-binding motif-containing protein, partial [Saprospiraceae bacterium]